MNKIYVKRRSNIIKELIVGIINDVIQDDRIGHISITDVELSNDYSFSTVYYTILDDIKEKLLLVSELIEKNKKKIRLELATKLEDIKKIPNLIFKYDTSYDNGIKIDRILKDIKK
ncbi:30S ribosome-binding factor RbfA [Candidatus Phytoplasma sacchari]|uniref:Ribosome-binding factor A n=1 Tax=Candidatus Phytoplasma sacchari TaxID=2609813 RepID=A0ABY7M4M9_9MOLU|nr:30S ribosome-binding factor RbfA [Candidatus Phytoplasma sacchari]KAB8122140.1 30S ribosome-binding factor RbfA [Candidatus Phytoplasma sacchari]WBL31468.1 30S ribosome-binding factor RbfA [Candidatus Phytoplasma sacchari]